MSNNEETIYIVENNEIEETTLGSYVEEYGQEPSESYEIIKLGIDWDKIKNLKSEIEELQDNDENVDEKEDELFDYLKSKGLSKVDQSDILYFYSNKYIGTFDNFLIWYEKNNDHKTFCEKCYEFKDEAEAAIFEMKSEAADNNENAPAYFSSEEEAEEFLNN